jgi:hypothetical protein
MALTAKLCFTHNSPCHNYSAFVRVTQSVITEWLGRRIVEATP